MAEGFDATVSADGLNLPDKRDDPGCWLRSGFESPHEVAVILVLCGKLLSFTPPQNGRGVMISLQFVCLSVCVYV